MSRTLYTKHVQHTPVPRGPASVGCRDVCVEGQDAVLLRLFFPTPNHMQEQEPEGWMGWYLGQEYSVGFASFIVSTGQYFAWILRLLAPLIYLYGEWLSKGLKVPAKWHTGKESCSGGLSSSNGGGSDHSSDVDCSDDCKGDSDSGGGMGRDKMPVVVVSHGMANHRSCFSTLATDLASHGFFVAVIEHREGSSSASFHIDPSGAKVWIDYTGYSNSAQLDQRVTEVFSAVAACRKLNEGLLEDELEPKHTVTDFKGALDMSNLVLLGHSYGGTTTLKALTDQRNCFRVGITLDPWMFPVRTDPGALGGAVNTPILSISTDGFNKGPNLKSYRKLREAHQHKESMFYTMRGTSHAHGYDAPWVTGRMGWWITGGSYQHAPETINNLQNNLILTFVYRMLDIKQIPLASSIPVYENFISKNLEILMID